MPLPAEANEMLPGFALAAAITSCTVLYGLAAPTTSTFALVPISVIGWNDFSASYGIVL